MPAELPEEATYQVELLLCSLALDLQQVMDLGIEMLQKLFLSLLHSPIDAFFQFLLKIIKGLFDFGLRPAGVVNGSYTLLEVDTGLDSAQHLV